MSFFQVYQFYLFHPRYNFRDVPPPPDCFFFRSSGTVSHSGNRFKQVVEINQKYHYKKTKSQVLKTTITCARTPNPEMQPRRLQQIARTDVSETFFFVVNLSFNPFRQHLYHEILLFSRSSSAESS